MKRIPALMLAAVATAGLALPAATMAKDTYPALFRAAYPAAAGSRIDGCSLCHTSVPNRNPYGAAWRNAGRSFTAIDGLDSDGDGFANGVEIAAFTFPGNAADHPAPADGIPPTVDSFDLPATSATLAVSVLSFTASDNIGVSGYLLTESATEPPAGAPGWRTTAPTSHTFADVGTRTLYAWAKDAAGNVSSSLSDTVEITAPPPPTPIFSCDFTHATRAGDPDWERKLGRFGGIRGTFVALGAGRNLALVEGGAAGLNPFGGGRIEAKFRFFSPVTATRAEVLFDYQDPQNHRYVRLDRRTGRLSVGQVGTVGGETAGSPSSVPIPRVFSRLDLWHRLRIDADPVSGTVTVFVDRFAQPVLSKSFTQTGIGRVGLAASAAQLKVAFDNVVVWDTGILP